MESIGSRLKAAREAKGITIEQAQKETRIHSGILVALENDRVENAISGPLYVKSFIKKYANYLGLDGTALSEGYSGERPEFTQQISALKNRSVPSGFPLKKILSFVAAILVIIICARLLLFAGSKVKTWLASRPKAVKVEASKPKATRKQIPRGEDLILSIKTRADVYLKVKADGSIMYDDILKKGSADKWEAKQSLEISTSKAEAVIAELNGTSLGSLGKGVVKGILITKDGLRLPK